MPEDIKEKKPAVEGENIEKVVESSAKTAVKKEKKPAAESAEKVLEIPAVGDSKAAKVAGVKKVKKAKKQLAGAIFHVHATFNNTKIVVSDLQGNVVGWSSASKAGFKGSRKSTPFAAQVASSAIAKDCAERFGIREAHVRVKGPGPGRESAVRAVETAGIKVLSITDVTGIPHNGCKDPKKRRV